MTNLKTDGSSKKKVLITSIVFMGLSHILYFKQYVKGVLYALIELVTLVMMPVIIRKITELITLGYPQPELPVKMRSNSIFMLIDGVMLLALLACILAVYIISVKSALREYRLYCATGSVNAKSKSVKHIVADSFRLWGMAPTILLVVFLVIVPLVFSACVAFTDYSSPDHIPPNNTVNWVGFKNFVTMFGGNAAWTSAFARVALWTLVWGVLATVTCYFGGMIMAVVLTQNKVRLRPVFQSIFILPYAVPAVLTMLIWRNLLNGSFGTVNRTLMQLGIIDTAIPWLSDPTFAKFTCVLVNLWAGFSYFMLLTTGTMTSISEDIYEAAAIDGATKPQIFRHIILPLVLYQTMPLIIMSFTHNINNFGAIYFLTMGDPAVADSTITSAGGTDILVTWIYNLTTKLSKYNYASVIAVIIFIVLTPFAIWQFSRTKSYKDGEL